jgi:hypothetical protein
MSNKISSGLKFIQDKTNTTTALVAALLPFELLAFGLISLGAQSTTHIGICILNNAKLIGLSLTSEYLNNKFKISDSITEKLGEKSGVFTKGVMTAATDISINFIAYGASQATKDSNCSLLNTILLTISDLAKVFTAEAINHGYIDFSEVYSNLLEIEATQEDL